MIVIKLKKIPLEANIAEYPKQFSEAFVLRKDIMI